jgi:hypothetical protein
MPVRNEELTTMSQLMKTITSLVTAAAAALKLWGGGGGGGRGYFLKDGAKIGPQGGKNLKNAEQ